MTALEKLHSLMGTKFMIPIIGGKELDLHRLFVEVTSRGGIEKRVGVLQIRALPKAVIAVIVVAAHQGFSLHLCRKNLVYI
ncbi:high mobility group B protein 15-like [Cucumis melo]|uniref:High mobility group B protein 15-like n=1 Tax=Cucumis melo TaxID=3656 RepID=A0ABM3L3T8_CUCME|nr:high mobility group B protein 15-like [Cucumis melo]